MPSDLKVDTMRKAVSLHQMLLKQRVWVQPVAHSYPAISKGLVLSCESVGRAHGFQPLPVAVKMEHPYSVKLSCGIPWLYPMGEAASSWPVWVSRVLFSFLICIKSSYWDHHRNDPLCLPPARCITCFSPSLWAQT